MQVAIVDDSRKDTEKMIEYLEQFIAETKVSLSPVCFETASTFFAAFTGQFDLVIFDIDMPGMNGVEAARLLRKLDSDVVIMFVTNLPQYALDGYEVDAVDYVLKPVSYGNFCLKLRKALRYVDRNRESRLLLHTTEGVVSVVPREILYVESELHYLTYHTFDQTYRVRGTLTEAENNLQSPSFARCNNSCLVNLRHVSAILRDDVQVGTALLKISRSRKKEFLEQFTRYLGGMKP
ncbi:MAG: LytTR family DNA-binding domain-containing protein [Clostridiales bacterium]|nr:LytTR family DNA-binding domain-containing protein [Clostridiales bacterium]